MAGMSGIAPFTSAKNIKVTLHCEHYRNRRVVGFRPREVDFGGYMTAFPKVLEIDRESGKPLSVLFPSIVDFKSGISLNNFTLSLKEDGIVAINGEMGVGHGLKLLGIDRIDFGVFPSSEKLSDIGRTFQQSKTAKYSRSNFAFSGEVKLPEDIDPQNSDGWLSLVVLANVGERLSQGHYSLEEFKVSLPLPGGNIYHLQDMFREFSVKNTMFGIESIRSREFDTLRNDTIEIELSELRDNNVGVRVLGNDMPNIENVHGSYFVSGLPFASEHDRDGNPTHMIFPSMFEPVQHLDLKSFNVVFGQRGGVRLSGRMYDGEEAFVVSEAHAALFGHEEKVFGRGEIEKVMRSAYNYEISAGFDMTLPVSPEINPRNGGWGLLRIVPVEESGKNDAFVTFPLASRRMESFTMMMKMLFAQFAEQQADAA